MLGLKSELKTADKVFKFFRRSRPGG